MNKDDLTSILRDLGADDPESWANSEVNENIPQLARFMFLKGAWQQIVPDDDTTWIDNVLQNVPADSNDPFAGAAHSMRAMLDAGISKSVIAQLVRAMQAEFLSGLCYMMDDPGSVEGNDEYVDWSFVELDSDGNTGRTINCLHESVLETDPTGREVRPIP
jgi:hypothetical protein